VTAEVMEARDGSGAKAESEPVGELPPAAGGLELTRLHSKAARARGPWDREGIRQAMLGGLLADTGECLHIRKSVAIRSDSDKQQIAHCNSTMI
jgi:hypothetical protein